MKQSQAKQKVILVSGILVVLFIAITVGALLFGGRNKGNPGGSTGATPTPFPISVPRVDEVNVGKVEDPDEFALAATPVYYQIGCRYYEYTARNGMVDLTEELDYLPVSSYCPVRIVPALDVQVPMNDAGEYGQLTVIDLPARKVLSSGRSWEGQLSEALVYDAAADYLYYYDADNGSLWRERLSGRDRELFVKFPRELIGRDGYYGDIQSLTFSPNQRKLLLNDTSSQTETSDQSSIFVIDLVTKAYQGYLGTNAAWLDNDNIVFVNNAIYTGENSADFDDRLYQLNIMSDVKTLLLNRIMDPADVRMHDGRVLVTVGNPNGGSFETISVNPQTKTSKSLGVGNAYAVTFGDYTVAFVAQSCSLLQEQWTVAESEALLGLHPCSGPTEDSQFTEQVRLIRADHELVLLQFSPERLN